MKLSLLTESQPFSFTFSRSFRVGGAVSEKQGNFLRAPGVDEDDAARVLFSSQGELKIDGKGEELAIDRDKPVRDDDSPSYLGRALGNLLSITNDIQSIQENLEKGVYGSEEQATAAQDELSKLRGEYDRIINNDNFQAAVSAVKKVRADLQGLDDDELYGKLQGKLPLIGNAVQEAAEEQDASLLSKLQLNLDKLLQGVSEGDSAASIEQLKSSIEEAAEIDGGGKEPDLDKGKLEFLLFDLQETTRKLRFLKDGEEKGIFTDDQLESAREETRELKRRYQEIIDSEVFKEISSVLNQANNLRNGDGGTPVAARFAEANKALLGGAYSELLNNYRFGDLDKLNNSLFSIGEASGKLDTLSSDELGKLSSTLGDAIAIVSGATLEDSDSKVNKQTISLTESVFETYKRKIQSTLIDEVDDFFEIIAKNSGGTYTLIKETPDDRGKFLDIIG